MDDFFETTWCGMEWTPFLAFTADIAARRTIPNGPGLYRIRVAGTSRLAYIGQTGRNLRERISDLVRNTLAEEMPFNDPHTAGPRLWSYRIEDGLSFESSAAPSILSKPERMAFESFLIWNYRRSAGESPLCNFGRLHPSYLPSRNRRTGVRGRRLPDGEINPNRAVSLPPLELIGLPTDRNWLGLHWSEPLELNSTGLNSVPTGPGVYRLMRDSEFVYYGEAAHLAKRLRTHAKDWKIAILFSFATLPLANAKSQRLEVENDLIGAHLAVTGKAPNKQFGAS